jgi:peptidoglycan-N-acetylglucosamine deacetylase
MSAPKKDVRVALTFDFDACCLWIGTLGATSPSMISRGEFGPIGLRRILDLLDQHGVKSTFFIPGHSALAFPEPTKMIQAAGHEIGHHGWVHENPAGLTPDQERVVIQRGLEALDRVAGVRPVGYRSPAWDNSPSTVPHVARIWFRVSKQPYGERFRALLVSRR